MYNKLVARQRRLNPSRPKLPLPGEFTYKSIDLVYKEVRDKNYTFVGCHYLGAELWLEDNRPLLVGAAEFMRKTNSNWEDREYLYLPLKVCLNLLPFIRVGGLYLSTRYPTADDLIIRSIDRYPVVYDAPAIGVNPLLPGFKYTGKVVRDVNSTLYTYIDGAGDYSEPGTAYLSPLRPRGLDNPLGRLGFDSLLEDSTLYGCYPERLEPGWVGQYTGYVVIDILGKKWYQYREGFRHFLLDSPPDSDSYSYYTYWSRMDDPSIKLTGSSISYVEIVQQGTAVLNL
jgi:hypothetical protein